MAMDSWSLNKEIERLDGEVKKHYDIIGALATKIYMMKDKLEEMNSPPKVKKKSKVTKDATSK